MATKTLIAHPSFGGERQPFADRQDIRRSVGEMLLGIDDLRGHELRQEFVQTSKLLSQKKARLDSLVEAAVKTDPNFSIAKYADLIGNAQHRQRVLERDIADSSTQEQQSDDLSQDDRERIAALQSQLMTQNEKVEKLENDVLTLSLNSADSEIFIASLEADLEALMTANTARDLIGDVTLLYCPICLATLSEAGPEQCPLCKSSVGSDAITGGRLRYEQELKHQIAESKRLLDARRDTLKEQEFALKAESQCRNKTLGTLRSFIAPTSRIDARVSLLLKEYGYLSRLVEDLARLDSLQSEVSSLEKEVHETQSKLEAIERELKQRQTQQESRRNYCQSRIGDLTIEILHEDVVDSQNDTPQ
jgi:chromosome segregation ATPase